MKTFSIATITLLVGVALGYVASDAGQPYLVALTGAAANQENPAASDKPLYWVAPMDPNYQRDKPGKSPMGMDLVPVYAEDLAGNNDIAGTVKINPAVENNLGVKTQGVTIAPLTPQIETVGYIAFDESRLWQTNVRVSGWVEKLNINAVGERVNKGDVLFTLYSPELVKAQEELLNAYRTERSGLIKGATERLVTLGVDRAQIKQIVRQGKAQQNIQVKALDSGIIASLNIREGGFLSPAQAVISGGPIDEVWVDAEVFERQAHWIKAGSKASMRLDALPGQNWQGEVDYVYPILDPKTRTLRMRLKFSNADYALKPNMFANITLQPQTQQAVMTIPRSSVIRSGGMTRVVLSEGNGKYRSARIEVGREAGEQIEVLAGLTKQDLVVTSAHFLLDSESSQTADLSRINGIEPALNSVWAKGEITQVMAGHNMLTINHQPVKEWDWPGMVMDFTLADGLQLTDEKVGQNIDFEMQKTAAGGYEIINYQVSESTAPTEVWASGTISMLMADFGMLTIAHQAVNELNWQAGEMNFSVNDSAANKIDLSQFAEGQEVRFLLQKQGQAFQLIQVVNKGDKL
ncbi:efflux RND transporter periplasmic adaptor subunit [Motilimonas cestriensis]|uniref:efflux RND transporter periplasmic adaptor subunit n=1 Tax=Motilimonas cestriensis TaxID=2742685 RepID=UPI003DA40EBB